MSSFHSGLILRETV